MTQTIEINGTEYPFAFTYRCMRQVAKTKGLDEIEQSEKAFLLAINNGYKREGLDQKMSPDELIDILDQDPNALRILTEALSEDMGKLTGEEDGEGNSTTSATQ